MASEKYHEVMRTDFGAEAVKSINAIFESYNETMDIVQDGELTLFDLDKQLSILRWAEARMNENLEDFKILIDGRKQRKAEKLQRDREEAKEKVSQ